MLQQIPRPENSASGVSRGFLLGAFCEIGLGVLALILGGFFGIDPRESIPHWHHGLELARQVGIGIMWAAPIIVVGISLEHLPIPSIQKWNESISRRLFEYFANFHWGEWLTLCVAAGVGEELLFRGFLQSGLLELPLLQGLGRGAIWTSIGITSIVFGLCHYLSTTYFVLASLFGIYFGVCFYWTGEIITVMVAHAVYDAALIGWMLRTYNPTSDGSQKN